MEKKNKTLVWIIAAAVVLVLIIALSGGKNDDSGNGSGNQVSEQVEAEPDDTMPIDDLVQAYEGNEVAAKKKYQGKTLRFKGKITSIGEVLDKPYIQLDYNLGVSFYFRDPNVVADFQKGQFVKIEGVLDGNLASLITFKNCRLVE